MTTLQSDPSQAATVAAIVAVRRRAGVRITILAIALIAGAAVALGIGPVGIPVADVIGVLSHRLLGTAASPDWAPYTEQVVWTARAPRVAMAAVAGAALAVAGAILQAVVPAATSASVSGRSAARWR